MMPIAYVGPGAGFAFFSTALLFAISAFILLFAFLLVPFRWFRTGLQKIIPVASLRYLVYAALIAGGLYGVGYMAYNAYSGKKHPRMIVLGMDGLDPDIVREMVDQGKLPNFKRLIKRGDMADLKPPNPPISPTSWASFITGTNPGRHGIMGFIGRDEKTYAPKLFTTFRAAQTFLGLPKSVTLGSYSLQLAPKTPTSSRQGRAFWDVTSSHGIRTNAIKVPVTFPPEAVSGKMLSGLGTPDIKGTQGTFTLWSTDPKASGGGTINRISFTNNTAKTRITGPNNTMRNPPKPTRTPLELVRTDTGVSLEFRNKTVFVEAGTWTDWVDLEFSMGLGMTVSGTARFHLNALDPFSLYMTPVQIDPADPVMAISHPESYAPSLAKRIGSFYTMGMPQDDSALKSGAISDTTFIEQSYQGLRERRRIMNLELNRERNGLLVGVFDTTDRIQHLFWRHRDKKHPLYDPKKSRHFKDVIPNVYKKMDEILGTILDTTDSSVPIMIVSDHGFTTFRRQFHLNDWLVKNDYMTVRDGARRPGRFFRTSGGDFYVDWDKTRAYQVGLTGIYLNIKGREKNGTVPAKNKWAVARNIKQDLEAVTDPRTGRKVFKNVYLSKNIYDGLFWQGGPDLILGYNKGYRTSWASARGGLYGDGILSPNTNKWSGDHVIDNSLVPGSVITSFELPDRTPSIVDIAPTIYDYYDIEGPKRIDGQSLLKNRSEQQ